MFCFVFFLFQTLFGLSNSIFGLGISAFLNTEKSVIDLGRLLLTLVGTEVL